MLDEMGVGQKMQKDFAMFTTCSMASLALPGMSGFVAELMVFCRFSNSDAYNPTFKLIVVFLMAVGVILTPIYLSMLRRYSMVQRTRIGYSSSSGRCGTARGIYHCLFGTNYWDWSIS